MRIQGFAALLALASAGPATAADWDSVSGWDVYEVDATRCVVGRVYADRAATFGIIMAVDGEVRLFAMGAGWAARAGRPVDAGVGLDGQVIASGPSIGIEQQNNRGFVSLAPPTFLTRFTAARALTVRVGAGAQTASLPLAGSAAGLAQGQRCLAKLRTQRAANVPAASAPTKMATAAVARGSKAAWMADVEYPAAALRAEQEGSVTVKLAIDTTGGVSNCAITKSSGSSTLDAATCRALQRRARYQPATSGGLPVASSDQHTVRWTMPD